MIAAITSIVGARGLISAGIGFTAGLLAMNMYAGIFMIPAAEAQARQEVRAEVSAATVEHLFDAQRESHEIERSIPNETDDEIRCLLTNCAR